MRQLWTDDELDQALAELHADVRPTPNGLATVRDRVLNPAAARGPRFRSPWFPLAAAAAVAALVTSVLVLLPHTVQPAAPPTATDLSSQQLSALLAKIHYSDPTVAPGQFKYVREQLWGGGSPDGLVDQATTTWQPATWTDEWLRRTSIIGMVPATYANGAIKATGPEKQLNMTNQDVTAACGDFDSVNPQVTGHLPCVGQKGGWLTPTPEWLAALPRDPEQLLDEELKASQAAMSPLYMAIYALRSGVVPADVRAALYRALAGAPGSYGRENVPNLQGKRGLAIGVIDRGIHDELLIDPSDGSFLGERQYSESTGTVIAYSALSYAVVDGKGVTPK
ncbi:CU044_5270 family protein [Kutzneria sp. NPDC052558]|uniref:CU044_5270 family protein n=1 Tax=Kutzneria sp. NPDC052558 TaxID=3364121 RepID=UPI0037CC049F